MRFEMPVARYEKREARKANGEGLKVKGAKIQVTIDY